MASETIKQEESIKLWEWNWLLPWKGFRESNRIGKETRGILKQHFGEEVYRKRRHRELISAVVGVTVAYTIIGVLVWFGIDLAEYLGVFTWIEGTFTFL